ncbi:DUF2141 domain-containing protein [Qipengyuania mesophila]|uniref:DUF2141 domain-containing protein n=1 Tax=Qipengyuania mesophila TaxID=2867246 RepID=UPI003559CBF0
MLGNSTAARQDVVVTVINLRSAEGTVLACLTPSDGDFPDCGADTQSQKRIVRANTRVTIVFNDVAPGDYAISLLHDENGNGKVDKALFMPTEGFGFSRDAKLRLGPPRFSAAAFHVTSDAPVYQTIRMRYLSR